MQRSQKYKNTNTNCWSTCILGSQRYLRAHNLQFNCKKNHKLCDKKWACLLVILSILLLVALSILLLCNVCPPACCLVYTLPVILVSSLYEMLFSCLLPCLYPACNLVYPPPCLLLVVWGGVLWLCDQTERKQYQPSASKYFQSTIPSSVC